MADRTPTSVYRNTSADEFGGLAVAELQNAELTRRTGEASYHVTLAQVYATLAQAKAVQEAPPLDYSYLSGAIQRGVVNAR